MAFSSENSHLCMLPWKPGSFSLVALGQMEEGRAEEGG